MNSVPITGILRGSRPKFWGPVPDGMLALIEEETAFFETRAKEIAAGA